LKSLSAGHQHQEIPGLNSTSSRDFARSPIL
jgi:hypothetical protein